jgi:single-strand DNA-binding protein
MADNTVTIVGNLTRDPELRFTTGGKGIASFGLAVNRRYQQNGEWQEKVSFFNVSAWDQLGENAAASLTKGSRVIVTGRLEQREYETQQGEKRNVVEIVADEIGPSLRWATATVERTQRTNADGGQGGGGYQGGNSGGRQGGGFQSGNSGGGRPADPVYGDEEPF